MASRRLGVGDARWRAGRVLVRPIDRAAELGEIIRKERSNGRRVGLVPTMGALHDGHRALIERAASQCDVVVVSIFVNPTQFGSASDLANYPRRLDADLDVAAAAGAALCFSPSEREMYPEGKPSVTVDPGPLARGLEGASRPSHFGGVATVVTKLFAIVAPDVAYFGEKDYQQLVIIRRLVQDLSFPIDVVGCETVREPDGLALSSRNEHLSRQERVAATALYRALRAGRESIGCDGEIDAAERVMAAEVAHEPLVHLDYAACVDAATLEHPRTAHGELRLLIGARCGSVRLIDNIGASR